MKMQRAKQMKMLKGKQCLEKMLYKTKANKKKVQFWLYDYR